MNFSGIAQPSGITYRQDIDGLRAIAVLSVVIFHAFPETLRGGFIGVDVFFVISGYLISSLIFMGIRDKTFRFSDFYARRVRRIFPALILVLAASLVAGWFWLLQEEYRKLGGHAASGAGFVANFVFRNEDGYFDSGLKPLLHVWSLSVEEQYYLIHPLLIWCAWRLGFHYGALIVLLFLLSMWANISNMDQPSNDFFFPHARFWELWAGSFLAWLDIFRRNRANEKKLWHDSCSLLGILLLAASVFFINKEYVFPGWRALLPVMGTCLLIWAGPQSWINRRMLSCQPMVFIGLVSYPLYLWHWPLLTFGRLITNNTLDAAWTSTLVALSFLLAVLTWRFLEMPIRFGRGDRNGWIWIHGKMKAICLVLFMVLVGGTGFYVKYEKGFPERLDEHVVRVTTRIYGWGYPGKMDQKPLRVDSEVRATTLFYGDSNMAHYYPRIEELITHDPENTHSAIFMVGASCFPVTKTKSMDKSQHCDNLAENVYAFVKSHPEIDTVALGASWGVHFTVMSNTTEERQKLFGRIRDDLKMLVGLNKRIFLVLLAPQGHELDPVNMIERKVSGFSVKDTGGIARHKLDAALREGLIEAARDAGARIIDPADFLCQRDHCPALDQDGSPIYKDAVHLNPSFARYGATFIDQTLRP